MARPNRQSHSTSSSQRKPGRKAGFFRARKLFPTAAYPRLPGPGRHARSLTPLRSASASSYALLHPGESPPISGAFFSILAADRSQGRSSGWSGSRDAPSLRRGPHGAPTAGSHSARSHRLLAHPPSQSPERRQRCPIQPERPARWLLTVRWPCIDAGSHAALQPP